MKKLLLVLALLSATAAAFAVENQAFWGVFAETRVQKMAGMPALPPMPPGMDAAAMAQIPGMAAMLGMGAPQRALSVRLWSPGLAPEGATATIAPPAGLKQGDRLALDLYRPKPGQVESGGDEVDPDVPDFTIKRYWGSAEKVKPGQPEVIRWDTMSPEVKAAMRREAAKASKKETYFYKPDWTTGYWPTGKQPGTVAGDAVLPGKYALTTSYTGNVTIDVPQSVDFLAPIELSSPDLKKVPALTQAITFRWKPVPGVLGYHARIMGMQGKKTLILWSSSEIQADPGAGWDYLQMAEVAEMVKSTAMMEPARQEVVVPAGIFKECDMVMFTMVGYGPGAALAEGQPLPRVQTKTTLNIMLGGKAMAEMGGMDD